MSGVAVAALAGLFFVSLGFLAAAPNRDRLDPFRIVSGIFLLVYCLAPLCAEQLEWNFEGNPATLLASASLYVLAAFLILAAGYHLPLFRPFPEQLPRTREDTNLPLIRLYGLALFVVGLLSYILLVARAGGPMVLIGGVESRVEFAKGMGYLLHGSLFLLSGGAIYWAAHASRRTRFPWLAAWPLLLTAALFVLLQNRSRVLWGLIVLLVISHYRIQPARLGRLAAYGLVATVFFVFLGSVRQPTVRPLLLIAPVGVVRGVLADFFPALQTLLGFTLNRIQQVMLALENFPERVPYERGTTFLGVFNPVARLMGLSEAYVPSLGHRFFELARPDLSPWLETGYHPSLVGEMLANFPWYLALLAFLIYGVALRTLYNRLVVAKGDVIATALYAVVLFRVINMVVVGVGQLLFGILVVALPILVLRGVSPHRARLGDAAAEPVATGVPSPPAPP
jgi:hypothetical protein